MQKSIKPPPQGKVFVTDGCEGSALAITRSLGQKGIRVIVGHTHTIATACFSRYCFKRVLYRDPFYGEEFISDLKKAITKYHCGVLFPVTDFSLMQISLHRKELSETDVRIPIPEHNTILKARDKLLTLKAAEKEGVPHPKTLTPNDLKELEQIGNELNFPVVVKPRTSCGGAGMEYVYSKRQLKSAFLNIRRDFGHYPMVQEFIPGTENVYSIVCIFDEKSNSKASIVMRKIREDPPSGGACTFGETVWNPQIADVGINFLKKMKWYGIATVELKVDPRDNVPKLMEINPRWLGYASLAVNAGVDLPYILYRVAVGDNVECVTRYNVGLKFSRLPHDVYTFMKFLRTTENKKAEILKFMNSYMHGKIRFDLFSPSDPLPPMGFVLDILLRMAGLHHPLHPAQYSFRVDEHLKTE